MKQCQKLKRMVCWDLKTLSKTTRAQNYVEKLFTIFWRASNCWVVTRALDCIFYIGTNIRKTFGAVSERHCERSHQNMKVISARYQERWDVHMLPFFVGALNENIHRLNNPEKAISKNFYLHM